MSRPALVLVHGGQHTARCWEPTVDELARREPGLRVLAVDMPGRGCSPGDLATLTIEECVSSVVDQIEQAGLDEVVLVGHSLAGISIPAVATRLGARRVRHLVMVACCVPPQGKAVVDTLYGPLRLYARGAARTNSASKPLPRLVASQLFCNGMTRKQRAFTLNQLCNEGMRLNAETVDRRALPTQIRRTWVLTLRDRALRPSQQRRFAENLGGVDEVVEIDACHDVMVSRPAELATVLANAAQQAG